MDKWEDKKKQKRKEFKNDNNKWINSLSRTLIDWNIKYHYSYKYEMKILTYNDYRLLNRFRDGHNRLNAQSKYNKDKRCIQCTEGSLETTEHFVFHCIKYNEYRDTLLIDIDNIYFNYYNNSFMDLDYDEKLKFILFPFQEELNKFEIKRDKQKKEQLLNLRMNILQSFTNYIINTQRFKDAYYRNTYFTF